MQKQYSTGGKAKLLGITKRGNVYLRKMFVHGARAVLLRGVGFQNQLHQPIGEAVGQVCRKTSSSQCQPIRPFLIPNAQLFRAGP